ncbi:GGDEF domain-containing protein [Grimontia sp. NTOU-MAR1]|uniref:GGDEF domain-containing protein n=1 Tax=Grimontia sp. NTOU-MAR1 TaxID=3111011 RepID=UPI002DB93AA7|nr:sensor domain-containing diguanylate cyclase [Grimontia sp. NTOU-MAR1]WRW00435.1 sensor domain-containing diguanylate cyclase [Grimontia sp. NTOU-MAR1]
MSTPAKKRRDHNASQSRRILHLQGVWVYTATLSKLEDRWFSFRAPCLMTFRKLNIVLAALTLSVGAILVFHNVRQAEYVRQMNESWNQASVQTMQVALDLAALERSFGYVGFIHHFKNYVLRRDETYYHDATESYWKTVDALRRLMMSDLPERDRVDLLVVQKTLNAYFHKLNELYLNRADLTVEVADNFLAVDDTPAREALVRLRADLIPNLQNQYDTTAANNQTNEFWALLSSSYPLIVILVFAFTISLISRKVLMRAKEIDTIFDSSPDAFIYSNAKGKILRANKMATKIFGYSEEELRKMKIEELVDSSILENHRKIRERLISDKSTGVLGEGNAEIRGMTKSGQQVPLNVAISAFVFGRHKGIIAIARDMTTFKRMEIDSTYDALTGVFNHRNIEAKLDDELKRAKRYGRVLSILLVDLDNVKGLNDSEGHSAGDRGLAAASEHLRIQLRKHDHVGRWGGDEFLVVCPELGQLDASEIADRIRRRFEDIQFPWSSKFTMSIGIATLGPNSAAMTTQNLFDEADQALYVAKERGRNRVEHFAELQRPKRIK